MPDLTPYNADNRPTNGKLIKPRPLDYRPHIQSEVDQGLLTQEQADAFLKALYNIMERFALDGRDFEPVDKLIKGFEKAALSAPSMVQLRPSTNTQSKGER